MKILITGGAGFIGSHLTVCLLSHAVDVSIVDNLSTGLFQNIPDGIHFYNMDVTESAMEGFMMANSFDAVVHLAGQTMVDASIRDPFNDMKQNVAGTVNVLEGARKSGVKRVIFASTAASYGDVLETQLPVKETEPLQPMSFYGLSKVTVERYLQMYHQLFGLDYVVLRFANVYGERQGDGGEGGVISIFTKNIAQGNGIIVFGDGGQTRDFIYAGDVAAGIYAALNTKYANTVYNISTQTESSLKKIIEILIRVSGKDIKPKYEPVRTEDIYRSMLSNEKAKKYLGWNPKMSLEEGLARTYEYFRGSKG